MGQTRRMAASTAASVAARKATMLPLPTLGGCWSNGNWGRRIPAGDDAGSSTGPPARLRGRSALLETERSQDRIVEPPRTGQITHPDDDVAEHLQFLRDDPAGSFDAGGSGSSRRDPSSRSSEAAFTFAPT